MAITFEKVTVNSMRAVVAEAIRNAIMQGHLQPGERIVERKLASQFGSSLSVIREALAVLETEGFIVKRRNTATHVIQVNIEDANKMFELRAILEPYATSQAARRATAGDLEALREIYARLCERARENDFRGYLREDYALHDRIWQLSGNDFIRASLGRVMIALSTLFAIRCPEPAFDLMADAQEHLKILEALERNDAYAAEAHVHSAMAQWRLRPALYAAQASENRP